MGFHQAHTAFTTGNDPNGSLANQPDVGSFAAGAAEHRKGRASEKPLGSSRWRSTHFVGGQLELLPMTVAQSGCTGCSHEIARWKFENGKLRFHKTQTAKEFTSTTHRSLVMNHPQTSLVMNHPQKSYGTICSMGHVTWKKRTFCMR
jgi:hypothetical protein